MKHILTSLLLFSLYSCNNSENKKHVQSEPVTRTKSELEAIVMEKAKPAYTRAFSEISEIKSSIKLAEDGLLKKDQVVQVYNRSVGKTMGQLSKFSDVKTRIDTAGDAYIKFKWNLEAAKIAREMAAEKQFEIEKQKQ